MTIAAETVGNPGPPEGYPTVWLGEYAQQIYNNPSNVWNDIDELHGRLLQYHQGVAAANPGKAEYLTFRCLWNAAFTPLLHVIGVESTAELLDDLRNDRSLVSSEVAQAAAHDDKIGAQWDKPLLETVRVAGARITSATERFLTRLEEDEGDRYRPVWDVFCALHPRFCDLEQQYKTWNQGKENPWRRNDNPRAMILEMAVDTNEVVLSLFRPLVEDGTWNLEKTLDHSKELARAASVRGSNLFVDYFPLGSGKEGASGAHPYAGSPLDWDERGVWAVPSLREGPWRTPGYCPANPSLTSSEAAGQAVVRNVFGYVPGHTDRLSADFVSAAELRLMFIAHILDAALRRIPTNGPEQMQPKTQ